MDLLAVRTFCYGYIMARDAAPSTGRYTIPYVGPRTQTVYWVIAIYL